MALQDLPVVAELERRSQLEPWSEEAFRGELTKSCAHACVARELGQGGCLPGKASGQDLTQESQPSTDEKRIVGYICFWVLLDEVHILNITVDESHRRRGIGQALLLHALKVGWERGGRLALLEARAGNAAALALYRHVGFLQVGERLDYYGVVKESAVVMELRMDDAWRATWLD